MGTAVGLFKVERCTDKEVRTHWACIYTENET